MSTQPIDALTAIDTAAEVLRLRFDFQSHRELLVVRESIAELLAADREYDEALAALTDLNRRIAEQGWIEVEFDALRKAGERLIAARFRRQRARARCEGAS